MLDKSNQRVGVFLDVANLYHSAKSLYNARVDFQELLSEAIGNRKLVRALGYTVSSGEEEEKEFFSALNKMGVEVRTKELQTFSSGKQKGNMDMEIAIEAMAMAPKLDVIILGSGDGDFSVLVNYLKSMSCLVEVVAFGKSTSSKLIEAADRFVDLDGDVPRFTRVRNRGIVSKVIRNRR